MIKIILLALLCNTANAQISQKGITLGVADARYIKKVGGSPGGVMTGPLTTTTMTVTGSSFSVGGSTLVVAAGNTTVGGNLTVNGAQLNLNSTSETPITGSSADIWLRANNNVHIGTYDGDWRKMLTVADGYKVGVNEISPDASLEVAAVAIAPTSPVLLVSSANLTTSLFQVNADGNVGIGTTAPGDLLHVTNGIRLSGTGSFIASQSRLYNTTAGLQITGSAGVSIADSGGTQRIQSVSGIVSLQPNGGFVGINTTTPTKSLEVYGNAGFGDPVGEAGGIHIDGVQKSASVMISDLSNVDPDMLLLHRHSTTVPPRILSGLSNSDASGHTSVTAGQTVLEIIGSGVSNNTYTSYNKMAEIDFAASTLGTISGTSSPGDIKLLTTTDGAKIPSEKMRVMSNGYVGIGTTTPVALLFVGGESYAATVLADMAVSRKQVITDNSNYRGILSAPKISKTAAAYTGQYYGAHSEAIVAADNTQDFTEATYGSAGGYFSVYMEPGATGTMTNLNGIIANTHVNGMTVTNRKGVNIFNPYVESGSMVNNYGLYVEGHTGGTNKNFNIYSDGTAYSYFGGRIGISTDTPNFPLDVVRTGAAVQAGIAATNYQAVAAGVGSEIQFVGDPANPRTIAAIDGAWEGATSNSGGYMALKTRLDDTSGSTEKVRILANGRVGIGNTAPTAKLDVSGHGSFSGLIVSSGTGNNLFAGNVGVGTTNPTSRLHISGDATVTGTTTINGNAFSVGGSSLTVSAGNTAVSRLDDTAISSTYFWTKLGGLNIDNISTTANSLASLAFHMGSGRNSISAISGVEESTTLGALAFFAGGSGVSNTVPERMRITSGGNVGIGTTAPTTALHIGTTGKITMGADTKANLQAYDPVVAGELVYCTDCTIATLLISTGTAVGNFANVADRTAALGAW